MILVLNQSTLSTILAIHKISTIWGPSVYSRVVFIQMIDEYFIAFVLDISLPCQKISALESGINVALRLLIFEKKLVGFSKNDTEIQ